jgi:hypothetical protein
LGFAGRGERSLGGAERSFTALCHKLHTPQWNVNAHMDAAKGSGRNRLSNEFRLLAACCEWPAEASRDARIKALADGRIDWPLFGKLVRRHRVEGLVHRALSSSGAALPDAEKAWLRDAASAIGLNNLLQAAESARLHKRLGEAGIVGVFLKGATLSQLVYKMLGVKQAWDIDLLVPREQASAAAAILRNAGYERTLPGPEFGDEAGAEWATLWKETLWTHGKSGLVVELHTALVDNPRLLPSVSARPELQLVQLGSGMEVPTLEKDQLFAYLCVHGATHAWARLKWLADVAAFLRNEGQAGTERLYRRSVELGVGRSSAQALLLCEKLLSLPLPDALARELKQDRKLAWLVKLAISAMAGRGPTELDFTVFGTVVINLSHFLLGKGWSYKRSELMRKLKNPEDQASLHLPPSLHFVYPLVAVPRWVWRRYRLSHGPADPGSGARAEARGR